MNVIRTNYIGLRRYVWRDKFVEEQIQQLLFAPERLSYASVWGIAAESGELPLPGSRAQPQLQLTEVTMSTANAASPSYHAAYVAGFQRDILFLISLLVYHIKSLHRA